MTSNNQDEEYIPLEHNNNNNEESESDSDTPNNDRTEATNLLLQNTIIPVAITGNNDQTNIIQTITVQTDAGFDETEMELKQQYDIDEIDQPEEEANNMDNNQPQTEESLTDSTNRTEEKEEDEKKEWKFPMKTAPSQENEIQKYYNSLDFNEIRTQFKYDGKDFDHNGIIYAIGTDFAPPQDITESDDNEWFDDEKKKVQIFDASKQMKFAISMQTKKDIYMISNEQGKIVCGVKKNQQQEFISMPIKNKEGWIALRTFRDTYMFATKDGTVGHDRFWSTEKYFKMISVDKHYFALMTYDGKFLSIPDTKGKKVKCTDCKEYQLSPSEKFRICVIENVAWVNPAVPNDINKKIILRSTPHIYYSNNKNIADLIDRRKTTSTVRTCDSMDNASLSIDFVAIKICPTQYCIRNGSVRYYLTNWDFEGSNDGKHWHRVYRHQKEKVFARSENNEPNYKVGSWKIRCREYYRMFRLRMTGRNAGNCRELALAGFEIYGDIISANDEYLQEKLQIQNGLKAFGINRKHFQVIDDLATHDENNEYDEIMINKKILILKQVPENSKAHDKLLLRPYDYFCKINERNITDSAIETIQSSSFATRVFRPRMYCHHGHEIADATWKLDVTTNCNECGHIIDNNDNKQYFSCNYVSTMAGSGRTGMEYVICKKCYELSIEAIIKFNQFVSNNSINKYTRRFVSEETDNECILRTINERASYSTFGTDNQFVKPGYELTKIDDASVIDVGLSQYDVQQILKYHSIPFEVTFKKTVTNTEEQLILDYYDALWNNENFRKTSYVNFVSDFDKNGIIYAIGTGFNSKTKYSYNDSDDEWINPATDYATSKKIILTIYPDKMKKGHLSHILGRKGRDCSLNSDHTPNASFALDFVAIQICPTKYSLRSGTGPNSDTDDDGDKKINTTLISWIFEGSHDGNNWLQLDIKHHNFSLQSLDEKHNAYSAATFDVNTQQFYRMFRVRMIGTNADIVGKNYRLSVSGFEIYGKIKPLSNKDEEKTDIYNNDNAHEIHQLSNYSINIQHKKLLYFGIIYY
eukprot:382393_1